jgi:hypothetical protein
MAFVETQENPTERLARKVAEARALAAELRGGADELEASADEWAAFNASEA